MQHIREMQNYKFYLECSRGKHRLGDLAIERRIILEWMCKKKCEGYGQDSCGSGYG
jgi:hypothetical protein